MRHGNTRRTVAGAVAALSATVVFGAVVDVPVGAASGASSSGGSTAASGAEPMRLDGRQLFKQTCGGCHTLAAADTHGTVGPNLDEVKPGRGKTENQIRDGGDRMPSYAGDLNDAQISLVADFVHEHAGETPRN